MKIVVLTNNGSRYGKKLIAEFLKNNIPIESVVVINQPLSYFIKLFNFVKKRVGLVEAIYFSIRESVISALSKKEKIEYSDFNVKKFFTTETNSIETENILKQIKPDIIILGQTGILKKNIISTAKIGVLNAHPAILPYYRGIDCLKWAVLNDDFSKIGSSVHWVNEKVDEGNIISTENYQIPGNLSFTDLDWQLCLLCISGLNSVVLEILKGHIPEGIKQSKLDGKQYYKMPLKKERVVKKKLN